MDRSHLRATRLRRRALVLAFVTVACAKGTPTRTFDPATREVDRLPPTRVLGKVRVSLVEARYGATFVDLRVRIENGGDSPLCVRRDGLLLGFGELEYPVDLDGEFHPPSPETIVEGGSASELALQFRLTRALVDSARLHFRDLELGGERFGPISVPVPPRPAPEPI